MTEMNDRGLVTKAVLCDLDGTLVDSNSLHAEAWQRTFAHFGVKASFDDVLHQIGKGGDQLIPVFLSKEEHARLGGAIEKYRKQLFQREYFHRIKPFPGARELLQKMKKAGLRIAVASSAAQEDLPKLKEIAAINDLVEEETSSGDAERSKPAPDIFQAALERLRIRPAEALALGDTPWDVQSALNAGVKTITVTSGGWQEHELRLAGAIEVYKDVEQLAERFEHSALSHGLP